VKALYAMALGTLLGTGPALAEAPLWTVDAKASRITFAATQMNVTIPGKFDRFTATIRFDAGDLPGSKAVIDIDTGSVATPNRDIETEIKREPWFDVAHHPAAKFESTAFAHKEGDRYDVTGQLTLRGVMKTVTLPATIRVADREARASAEIRVSRNAFGIGQGQWSDTGVVADAVTIRFELVARRE
jgi:polyisoprenoid-binding protein YceI